MNLIDQSINQSIRNDMEKITLLKHYSLNITTTTKMMFQMDGKVKKRIRRRKSYRQVNSVFFKTFCSINNVNNFIRTSHYGFDDDDYDSIR